MDYSSLVQYSGKSVILTLKNGFWYKANIISVTEQSVEFIELKGRRISVSPEQIVLVEEVQSDK